MRGLGVKHVVVLGHALCGGIGALVDGREGAYAHYDYLATWTSIAQEVRDLLPNAVDIVIEHTAREGEEPPIEIGHQSPVELFTAYYADLHSGAEPPAELMSLFNRLHEEVTGAAH